MNVVTMPSDVKLPSTELKALGEASEFWRELGSRVGADILLSGIVDFQGCLLYTSAAADERSSVDLGGRRILKKKKTSTPHA